MTKHTLSDLQKLAETDPERIRVMVAECMGWQVHPEDEWLAIPPNSPHSVQPLNTIPRYTASLDAMAECEAGLTDEEHADFRAHLWEITEEAWHEANPETFDLHRAYVSASALHRAIAFVLTKQETKGEE